MSKVVCCRPCNHTTARAWCTQHLPSSPVPCMVFGQARHHQKRLQACACDMPVSEPLASSSGLLTTFSFDTEQGGLMHGKGDCTGLCARRSHIHRERRSIEALKLVHQQGRAGLPARQSRRTPAASRQAARPRAMRLGQSEAWSSGAPVRGEVGACPAASWRLIQAAGRPQGSRGGRRSECRTQPYRLDVPGGTANPSSPARASRPLVLPTPSKPYPPTCDGCTLIGDPVSRNNLHGRGKIPGEPGFAVLRAGRHAGQAACQAAGVLVLVWRTGPQLLGSRAA